MRTFVSFVTFVAVFAVMVAVVRFATARLVVVALGARCRLQIGLPLANLAARTNDRYACEYY
jgi:hypothetical protein